MFPSYQPPNSVFNSLDFGPAQGHDFSLAGNYARHGSQVPASVPNQPMGPSFQDMMPPGGFRKVAMPQSGRIAPQAPYAPTHGNRTAPAFLQAMRNGMPRQSASAIESQFGVTNQGIPTRSAGIEREWGTGMELGYDPGNAPQRDTNTNLTRMMQGRYAVPYQTPQMLNAPRRPYSVAANYSAPTY